MHCARASLPTGETVVVSRYGGQVLSWQDRTGRELLYLSPLSNLAGPLPIRGGVPVCFPQFAARGPLVKHGLARTRAWTCLTDDTPGVVRMCLTDDEDSRSAWPHRFRLELAAHLQRDALHVQLTVHNTDTTPWTFTAALHTYLRTTQVTTAVLSGLEDHTFEDALAGGTMRRETGPDLSQPLDRVYGNVQQPLVLRDTGSALHITQRGFEDVVVWNPGAAGAAKLPDMPAGDYRHMLCVEAAQVVAPVRVEPGEAWTGSQTLRQA